MIFSAFLVLVNFRHYYKGHPPGVTCDADCKANLLCGIRTGRSNDPNLCANIPKGYEIMISRRYVDKLC